MRENMTQMRRELWRLSAVLKAEQEARASEPKRFNLSDMLEQVTPENRHDVVDWGQPVGKEVIDDYLSKVINGQ
ncbi:TPA: hypothetical protein N2G37_004364 [Salmonella enterica]|nr:hypothetical protein [Salmonella enterica]